MIRLEYNKEKDELEILINKKTYKFQNEFIKIINDFIDGIYYILEEVECRENCIVKVYRSREDLFKVRIQDDEDTINSIDLICNLINITNKYFSKTSISFSKEFHYERYQTLKNMLAKK